MIFDKVLLFSGGLDSFIAYHLLGKPQTIYFDIGHRYSEVEKKTIKKLIPNTIIDSSLYLGDQEAEDAFIPLRNLYLCMLATKYSSNIYVGGIKEDRIADNSDEAFTIFEKVIYDYGAKKVSIKSPVRHLLKWELVKWYLDSNLNIEDLLSTVSCYSGEEYCGHCQSCFRKWVALKKNNITLPFFNKDLQLVYLKNAKEGKYIPERNTLLLEVLNDIAVPIIPNTTEK